MLSNTYKYIFGLLFVNFITVIVSIGDEKLVIQLPNGKIRGHVRKTDIDIPYYAFQEIPYASPPIDDLRFKEPVPPNDWEGILDTTNNTKICYQFGGWPMLNSSRENEDCLYLNVYSPDIERNENNLIPVYVYIHGGGFFAGDGSFESLGPDFLINYGIIVVTLNYRLGAFGFLTTGDRVIPGNNGIKDQHLALKWIKQNIRLFGGDPEKITIGGESAGGASVGYHLLSKKSSGLFRAAILQSGTAICAFSLQKNPRQNIFAYASALEPGFRSNSTTDLLELLKEIPAEQFKSTPFSLDSTFRVAASSLWSGIIEDPKDNNSFITGHMHENLENGNFNQVPVIVGICSEEMLANALAPEYVQFLGATYDNNVTLIVNPDYNVNETDIEQTGEAIKRVYTGDGNFADNMGAVIRILSDTQIATGAARHADLHSKYSDVYFYQFSHAGEMGNNTLYVEGAERVQHASELNYFWRTETNANLSQYPSSDLLAQQRLLTLWSNFVIYGNPTPEADSVLGNVTWPTMSSSNFTYLNINDTMEVRTDPRQYKQTKEIVDTYGNPPFDTY